MGTENWGVRIRPAVAGDEEGLAFVHIRSWQTAYRGILPDAFLDGLDVTVRVQRWRDRIRSAGKGEFSFVAEAAEGEEPRQIVGFIAGGPERDGCVGSDGAAYDGEVYAIYLLDSWRRRGVGRQLMAQAARKLIDGGYRSVLIWVLEDNARARRFYESLGGVPVGEKPVTIGQYTLPEVGYGWPNARRLLAAVSQSAWLDQGGPDEADPVR